MDSSFARAHYELGYVLAQMNRNEEAIAEFQKSFEPDKNSLNALSGLGYAYAVAGQKKQAEQVIEQLNDLARQHYVSPYHLAVIYAGLGEREKALNNLEKAAEERFYWIVFIKVEPIFESLRSEPRFLALVRRVGLS